MKTIDYDKYGDEITGNTETHMAVDENLRQESQLSYIEGFASASGVRNETAETGGRIKSPETADLMGTGKKPSTIDKENAGLAEN